MGARRTSRRFGRVLLFLLFLLALLSPFLMFHKDIMNRLSEQDAIRLERWQRVTYAGLGWAWPGTPDFAKLDERFTASGSKLGAPILIRIFKREFVLEIWSQVGDKFQRVTTYPICKWSGRLGPKIRQGDHQAPEGFYTVERNQLNPKSRWHKSFNLGYPNVHDRAHKRTGSFLMVHGGCSSVGCYAMTNDAIDEIWKIVTAALDGGQKRFQVQVFPFRMTEANLALRADDPAAAFWQSLKLGHDFFAETAQPPRISVCNGRYVAEAGIAGNDGSSAVEARCPKPAPSTAETQRSAG